MNNKQAMDQLIILNIPIDSFLKEGKTLSNKFKIHEINGSASFDQLIEILSLTDYTSLNPTDTNFKIDQDVNKILNINRVFTNTTHFPAVCLTGPALYSAKKLLADSATKLAAVANFPLGTMPQEAVLSEVKQLLEIGADEIDLVFPLADYLSGRSRQEIANDLLKIKNICLSHNATLKCIIQSDEIEAYYSKIDQEKVEASIQDVSCIALMSGVDMIKTSTGKGIGGASTIAAKNIAVICKLFAEYSNYAQIIGHYPGVKLSGGISSTKFALELIAIVKSLFEVDKLNSKIFRFGASRLVSVLLDELSNSDDSRSETLSSSGINGDYFSEQYLNKQSELY